MNPARMGERIGILLLSLGCWCCVALAQAPAQSPPPVPAEEQPEALTRGPVHEAFAQPVNVQTPAAVTAATPPPPDITETPPADRPAGDRYVWVPGYWSWDGDRQGYIWVSGCWRIAPPGTYWVPGYWGQSGAGWRWVPGFWASSETQELQYLPAPPPLTAEEIAAPAPPAPDVIWVPPCWYWEEGQYVRRRGYWLHPEPGWVWTPSCNVWTPRGYVFCAGYWDLPLEGRGLLFAPVAFARTEPVGFAFSPSVVLDLAVLRANLFVYPSYCHYFFGDYYDDAYVRIGIFPPFEVEPLHTCYDPIFVHERWERRGDPRWLEQERHGFEARQRDRDLRPPRTFRDMETRLARAPEAQRANLRLAEPLKSVVSRPTAPIKFEQASAETQQKLVTHAANVRQFGKERTRWESERSRAAPSVSEPKARSEPGAAPARPPQVATPPVEPRQPREPATPSAGAREPVATPQRREPVAVPERREPAAQPAAGRAGAASEHPAAPSERRAAEPERVKVPRSPIFAGPSVGEKAPARPADERRDSRGKQDEGNRRGGGR